MNKIVHWILFSCICNIKSIEYISYRRFRPWTPWRWEHGRSSGPKRSRTGDAPPGTSPAKAAFWHPPRPRDWSCRALWKRTPTVPPWNPSANLCAKCRPRSSTGFRQKCSSSPAIRLYKQGFPPRLKYYMHIIIIYIRIYIQIYISQVYTYR